MLDATLPSGRLVDLGAGLRARAASTVDVRTDSARLGSTILQVLEQPHRTREEVGERIAGAQRASGAEDVAALMTEGQAKDPRTNQREARVPEVEAEGDQLAPTRPYLSHARAPTDSSVAANPEVWRPSEPPVCDFEPCAQRYRTGGGLSDFEQASEIVGARIRMPAGACAGLSRRRTVFPIDLHAGEHPRTARPSAASFAGRNRTRSSKSHTQLPSRPVKRWSCPAGRRRFFGAWRIPYRTVIPSKRAIGFGAVKDVPSPSCASRPAGTPGVLSRRSRVALQARRARVHFRPRADNDGTQDDRLRDPRRAEAHGLTTASTAAAQARSQQDVRVPVPGKEAQRTSPRCEVLRRPVQRHAVVRVVGERAVEPRPG